MLANPLLVLQSCPATCGGGMCLPASGTCECYAANSGPTCQDCAAGYTQVRWLPAWLAAEQGRTGRRLSAGVAACAACSNNSSYSLPTPQPSPMPLPPRLLTLTLQVNGACVGDVVALGLVSPNPAEPPSGGTTSDSGAKSEP